MARRQRPLLELADLRPESPGVLVSRRHASPDLSAAWRVTPPAGGARCLRFDCPGARTGLLAGGRGGYATVRPGVVVEDQRQTGPGGQGTHLPGAGSAGVRDRAIGPGRGTSGGISAIGDGHMGSLGAGRTGTIVERGAGIGAGDARARGAGGDPRRRTAADTAGG